MYDVSVPSEPKITNKVKTGILIHAAADGGKAVGGSAPNALCLSGETFFRHQRQQRYRSAFRCQIM